MNTIIRILLVVQYLKMMIRQLVGRYIFETGANDVWVVKGEKSISFLILKML